MRKAVIGGLILLGFIVISIIAFYLVNSALYAYVYPPRSPEQPIAFSHKLHAGDNEIPCLFCHIYATKSRVSGVPSVQRCYGCHKAIKTKSPEIKKVLGYWKEKKPIPWVKVHDLPDYIYFTHKRHVKAGVRCQECHGPVETMKKIRRVAPLGMGWCLDCHRNRHERKGGPKGPIDCWECHA